MKVKSCLSRGINAKTKPEMLIRGYKLCFLQSFVLLSQLTKYGPPKAIKEINPFPPAKQSQEFEITSLEFKFGTNSLISV